MFCLMAIAGCRVADQVLTVKCDVGFTPTINKGTRIDVYRLARRPIHATHASAMSSAAGPLKVRRLSGDNEDSRPSVL